MAVASAGLYAKSAPHPRQPRQHPTTQFFTGRTCQPAKTVKALNGFECTNGPHTFMIWLQLLKKGMLALLPSFPTQIPTVSVQTDDK